MDVSKPNNWPRIQYMIDSGQFEASQLSGVGVDEAQTEETLKKLYEKGYTSEPHAAVAYHGLHQTLQPSETGIFLGTAHPAKFKSTVEDILNIDLSLPKELAHCIVKEDLSHESTADFGLLEDFLYKL